MAQQVETAAAIKLHQQGVVYLDVRTVPEFEGAHAPGAYNIPVLHRGALGMTENPRFVAEVEAAFTDKGQEILVACRAGGRGARAVAAMRAAGYTAVVDYPGGWGGNKSDAGWAAGGGPSTTDTEAGHGYAELKQ